MSAWSGKIRGGSALLTDGSDTWKRRCFGQHALLAQRLEHEIRVDGVARVAEPPAGIAEAHALDAVLDLELPAIGGIARIEPLDAVLRLRPPHRLELGMAGQHLVVDAADPVPARADLAVRHRLERRRRARRRKSGIPLRRCRAECCRPAARPVPRFLQFAKIVKRSFIIKSATLRVKNTHK